MNIGTLIATLGVDASQLTLAQKRMKEFEVGAQASINRVNAKLRTTGDAMKMMGKNMTRYVTLPLMAAGGGAIKMRMDFEASMSKIVGLVGVAKEQVDEWEQSILKMAPALGKSPKELADAMFFITSAGIRGTEAMEVLEMSAKASASGLGEVKVVADLVTSAMNAYGPAVLSAQNATDVLTAAVREGKAEADALATSMGMVLPIASNMGISFDQVGAAVAAMTRTGTNAQTASMQLRQMLNSLLKPTNEAEVALMGMGTSAAELRKTLREDGLIAALSDVKDLSTKYGDTVMSKVFPNIRALSGVLDIMGANAEDNIKIFESLSNSTGSAGAAFEAASQTIKFKWDQSMAQAKTTLTVLGETLAKDVIPMIQKIAARIGAATKRFQEMDSQHRQNIIRFAGIAAAAGPVLVILGTLVGKVLPALLSTGLKVVKMFNAMRLAAMANPYVALAVAITAVVAVVGTWVKKSREAVQTQEDLIKLTDSMQESITAQRVKVEQLLKVAQDENEELKNRERALAALNRVSPEYFGNLNLETINTNKATIAKQKYIQELLREAKVKAAQERLIELEKQRIEMVVEGQGRQLKGGQKLIAGWMLQSRMFGKAGNYMMKKGEENWQSISDDITTAQKAIQAFLKDTMTVGDLEVALGIDTTGGGGLDETLMPKDAALKNLENELKYIDIMSSTLGDSFDSLGAKTQAYQAVVEALARAGLSPYNETLVENAMILEDLMDSTDLYKTTMSGLAKELGTIAGLEEVMGGAYDGSAKRLDAYRQTVAALVAEYGVYDERVQQVVMDMEDADATLHSSETVMKNLVKQLDLIATKEKAYGDTYDDVADQIRAYQSALNTLIEYGYKPGNEIVDEFIRKLEELGIVQGTQAANTMNWGNFLLNAFQGMANGISDALSSTENILDSFWEFFKNFIKGMIIKLVAAAAAALLLAVALSAIGGANFGQVAKGMKFIDVFKGGFKMISGMGMAEGGTVPPGYPSDSYPAMLTTGETVLPPGALDKQMMNVEVTVKGVQRGEDLYYIVEEVKRKLGNTF